MLRVLLILMLVACVGHAEQPALRSVKNWQVRGKPGKITWVELHDIDPDNPSIIHVEILSRKKTDKTWHIDHLQPHVAITLDALQRSVVRPLRDKRGVYPESFDFGYKAWKESAKRDVCRTSLYECVDTGAK